uniref:Copper transport protein ATOX1 n=2 Tax=Neoaves TaxID=3078114 RepID=A0A8B9LZF2_9AVES
GLRDKDGRNLPERGYRGGRAVSAPPLPSSTGEDEPGSPGGLPGPWGCPGRGAARGRRPPFPAAPGALCGAGAQGPAWARRSRGPPLPPRREPGAGSWEPPPLRSAMPKHEFFVDMTCEGCSNAVTRVLHRLGGVQFDIDLPNKKVCIDSEHNVDTLLETLKKTGKNASYLGEKSAQ